jgi:hypothetical protein
MLRPTCCDTDIRPPASLRPLPTAPPLTARDPRTIEPHSTQGVRSAALLAPEACGLADMHARTGSGFSWCAAQHGRAVLAEQGLHGLGLLIGSVPVARCCSYVGTADSPRGVYCAVVAYTGAVCGALGLVRAVLMARCDRVADGIRRSRAGPCPFGGRDLWQHFAPERSGTGTEGLWSCIQAFAARGDCRCWPRSMDASCKLGLSAI